MSSRRKRTRKAKSLGLATAAQKSSSIPRPQPPPKPPRKPPSPNPQAVGRRRGNLGLPASHLPYRTSFAHLASRMVIRDRTKRADFFFHFRSCESVGLRREESLFALPLLFALSLPNGAVRS